MAFKMKSPALLKMVSALKNKDEFSKRQAKGMRKALRGVYKGLGGDTDKVKMRIKGEGPKGKPRTTNLKHR